jgi:hypothetical protein
VALITAGSIALLLLGGAALVGAANLVQVLQRNFIVRSTTDCLPSDFPAYPNAERAFAYLVGPICSEGFSSNDTTEVVLSYYDRQLNTAPWRLTRTATSNTIYFGRTDNGNASGEVQAFAAQFGSRITITYSP